MDGGILVHFFAVCSPAEVIASVGLTIADLYDAPISNVRPFLRRRIPTQTLWAVQTAAPPVIVRYGPLKQQLKRVARTSSKLRLVSKPANELSDESRTDLDQRDARPTRADILFFLYSSNSALRGERNSRLRGVKCEKWSAHS